MILLSYFFIQLNFDLVSHNFGSKFFFFFNNNLFFIESVSALGLSLLFVTKAANGTHLCRRLFRTKGAYLPVPRNSVLRCFPAFVVTAWVTRSYRPLVNYFMWNFCSVNVLNFDVSLQPANLTAVMLLFALLSGLAATQWVLLLSVLSLSVNWLWVFAALLSLRSRFRLLHTALLLFTALNLALCDVSVVS